MFGLLFEFVLFLVAVAVFAYFIAEARKFTAVAILCVFTAAVAAGLLGAAVREGITDYDTHSVINITSYLAFLAGFVVSEQKGSPRQKHARMLAGGLALAMVPLIIFYLRLR